MSKSYANVKFKDITRALIVVELQSERYPDLEDLTNFSKRLSKLLNSNLLEGCYTEFPSDLDNVKNYTLLFVLSTSHIAISTYFSKNEKYIDIEVSWCSRVDVEENALKSLINNCFGDSKVFIKILDSLGNVIKEF